MPGLRQIPRVRRRAALLAVGALAVCAVGGAAWWRAARVPERFAAVVEGRLYRSGSVTPAQLEHLATTYGIRTVVSLLNPDAPESVAEREAARRLGLRWENVPLPGNGASTAADRERIRRLVCDPEGAPILVHCGAGTNRAGLAVGLYRIHEQGWGYEQVFDELRRFDFEDEPHHENLRQALRREAEVAAAGPAGGPQRGP